MREGASLVAEGTALLGPDARVAIPKLDLDPNLLLPSEVPDDRDDLNGGDRVVLIVEDDADVRAHAARRRARAGFKGIVALRGDAGLALAHEFKPDAIILDIELPVMDGWTVLDRLKHHPDTRHIPVHIISAGDATAGTSALRAGAVAYLEKPVEKEALDDAFAEICDVHRARRRAACSSSRTTRTQRNAIVELIGTGDDVEITAVGSSRGGARRSSRRQHFDCMVLDLKLPEMTGLRAARAAEEGRALREPADHRLHRARS